ncbi:glutamate racemase [Aestuariicella sp. G3-2]|uniref:glutamate racemase n=1 Tax=Pseudomaricurvus albidus TaxID=2842452 RepID=UPI001C0D62BF|nr:glutamate racemase [Aestuariicella albida]MBU3069036.1 glutamate racemase [Aestuariicella albida]
MTTSFIGVYDSGLGGLSVLRAIHQVLPRERLVYFADSAHAPYGDRSISWIEQRVSAVVASLEAQGAKAVVLACNTATAVAVENLRLKYSIPIVAIEPGIKVAIERTLSGVVGVIGTTGTLHSDRYQTLLARLKGKVEVLSCATPGLVEYIEANQLEAEGLRALLQQYIQPMLHRGIDQLVLGCTHYPFIEQQIRQVVGDRVSLVNPAGAVANYLNQLLQSHGLLTVEITSALIEKEGREARPEGLSNIQVVTSGEVTLAQQFLKQSVGWQLTPVFAELPVLS